jgi:hypothetical protein
MLTNSVADGRLAQDFRRHIENPPPRHEIDLTAAMGTGDGLVSLELGKDLESVFPAIGAEDPHAVEVVRKTDHGSFSKAIIGVMGLCHRVSAPTPVASARDSNRAFAVQLARHSLEEFPNLITQLSARVVVGKWLWARPVSRCWPLYA